MKDRASARRHPPQPDAGGRSWNARWLALGVVVAIAVIAALLLQPAAGSTTTAPAAQRVAGGGKTMIEGGTGGATPLPVTTLVAFHATRQGGAFECLALAPPQATGPGSGEFTTNVMYVTGTVTSLRVEGASAVLRGTATVTGIGAGRNVPFTVWVTEGGPGATVKLRVSGLTFLETLIDGHIDIS
jgi:hypothetical protein